MKQFLLLSLVFFMGLNVLNAQNNVEVQGEIKTDSIWKSSIDTIKVIGDIFVDTLGSLTIEEGVVIEFQSSYKIDVEGRILVMGKESEPIVFTVSDTSGYYDHTNDGWLGIDFLNTDQNADSSIFEYAEFYYGHGPSGNKEEESGGAMFVRNVNKLRISNCRFKYNYTEKRGGAIHTKNSYLKIENCLFEENTSVVGGALNIAGEKEDASKIFLLDNEFYKNYSEYAGGALRLVCKKNNLVSGNIFKQNKAGVGGAVQLGGQADSTMFVNNFVSNNIAKIDDVKSENNGSGGGVKLGGNCTPIIINNIIANNETNGQGGGIAVSYYSNPLLMNNTIVNNSADSCGGGVFTSCKMDSVRIQNTIIHGNESEYGSQVFLKLVGEAIVGPEKVESTIRKVVFYNCNIQGDTSMMFVEKGLKKDIVYINNINKEPNFMSATTNVGADSDTQTADWKLTGSSSCLEAGDTTGLSFWYPTTDYFGNDRTIAGTIDIGAHEFELLREITVSSDVAVITENVGTLQLSAEITPIDAINKSVTWSVIDGTATASINQNGLLTATGTPEGNGSVTIRATANDGSGIYGEKEISISNQNIPVIEITVTAEDDVAEITTNEGTLQFSAEVLPTDATDKSVNWSIIESTGTATINSSGLVTATGNGAVTVKATANDGSEIYGEMTISISNQSTGINDLNSAKLNVYPNPATDFLYLEFVQTDNFILEVIDMTGKVVISDKVYEKKERIDISELNDGLYFIKVTNQSESFVSRFIKK